MDYKCDCCSENFYSMDGYCCPYWEYYNPDENACNMCHFSCAQCSGPAENECTACFRGFDYDEINNICIINLRNKIWDCKKGTTLIDGLKCIPDELLGEGSCET